jgi:hypothetical protein
MKKIAHKIQKSSEISSSPLLSGNSLYSTLLIILFVTLLGSLNSSAQQCSFNLTTSSNIESVNSQGRTYFVQLQNNSNDKVEINLTVSNSNTGKNPDATDTKNNVSLNAVVLNEAGQEITGIIELQPNEILKLQVKVSVPSATPIEHWNSMLLYASSDKCVDSSSSLILYTFIPNPAEN